MLFIYPCKVGRFDHDLVGDRVSRDVAEALDDVDGAVVDDHNLVEKLPGNGDFTESDNTSAIARNISEVINIPKRREERGNIFLGKAGRFSALDGEPHFSLGSVVDRRQLSIQHGDDAVSGED